jgi:hypothetical protein
VFVAPRVRDWPACGATLHSDVSCATSTTTSPSIFTADRARSLLTWLSRAPVRIGYDIVGRQWMYTRVVARPRELRARHSSKTSGICSNRLMSDRPSRDAYPSKCREPTAAQAVRRVLPQRAFQPTHNSWSFM